MAVYLIHFVSIPQSGFGAFELEIVRGSVPFEMEFQSLSRDSGRLNDVYGHRGRPPSDGVSIPQSGFGAFEHASATVYPAPSKMFQSLSRDSGRLNPNTESPVMALIPVSIPQSGFGAFERRSMGVPDPVEVPSFNPSVGIRGV